MKVRTTLRPDEQIEVGEAEYIDLKRDGLLVADYEGPKVEQRLANAAEKKEG